MQNTLQIPHSWQDASAVIDFPATEERVEHFTIYCINNAQKYKY